MSTTALSRDPARYSLLRRRCGLPGTDLGFPAYFQNLKSRPLMTPSSVTLLSAADRARGAPPRPDWISPHGWRVIPMNASTGCRVTPNGGDPRSEIAVMFDDRRRLGDRVYRLSHRLSPGRKRLLPEPSRLVSNVEVFDCPNREQKLVRSNFQINEFWDDETRVLAGWRRTPVQESRQRLEDFCQAGEFAPMRSMYPQPQHYPLASEFSG